MDQQADKAATVGSAATFYSALTLMEETNPKFKIMNRCQWVGSHPLEIAYHDAEWGVPVHDDRVLFEFLLLEGAQAGLNWLTVLKKRESYREAFAGFDPAAVARFDAAQEAALLQNPGIVRNRLKVRSAIRRGVAILD